MQRQHRGVGQQQVPVRKIACQHRQKSQRPCGIVAEAGEEALDRSVDAFNKHHQQGRQSDHRGSVDELRRQGGPRQAGQFLDQFDMLREQEHDDEQADVEHITAHIADRRALEHAGWWHGTAEHGVQPRCAGTMTGDGEIGFASQRIYLEQPPQHAQQEDPDGDIQSGAAHPGQKKIIVHRCLKNSEFAKIQGAGKIWPRRICRICKQEISSATQ